MDLRAIIFVPALVGCIIFGFVFALFAAHYYLTVLQSTGSGAKDVTWPSEPILDNFWKVFYLAWLIGLWLGPAYFLGRALGHGSPSPWVRFGIPLAFFWVCFPVSQLSSLSGPTIWLPLHPGVFTRMLQKPGVVLGFAGLSAAAMVVLGAGFHWAFFAEGLHWLLVGSVVFVLGGLLYGRLLGRLAFALAFTRPHLMRKRTRRRKPKRPKSENEEPAEESRHDQPRELPPIETPDEGPLSGYDVKFEPPPNRKRDSEARRKRQKRVVAELEESDGETTVTEEADADTRTKNSNEADVTGYAVHEPDGLEEEDRPRPAIEPREDEMRLLRRDDDVGKPPKQVWSPDLLGFLVQPGTLAVIGLLSTLCSLVGGMVRIAREMNPAADG